MKPPPRDDANQVIPHDHPDINNEHEVIRRISSEQVVEKKGKKVISSIAYKASTGKNGGMSVDLKQLIKINGIDPKIWVTTPRWIGSVIFKVSDLRGMNFMVGYDPILAPNPNEYHGEVWGDFKKSNQKKLKSLAIWFVPINNVDLV
jgi:hypothetical protein